MLLLASSVCGLFKWRQFEPEVILMAVAWYLRFSLSYRDVEELLAERGLSVDHVTVWRWVQRYAPELDRRLRKRLKATNDSWRMDETYVRVEGKWVYLYRAVDSISLSLATCKVATLPLSRRRREPRTEGCGPKSRLFESRFMGRYDERRLRLNVGCKGGRGHFWSTI
jgi:transposase, IS6 family